jgi:hypothetical protein
MGKFFYSADDPWGQIYMFKKGYKIVTGNMDEIETTGDASEDWIARYYYVDKKGNIFLNYKKGRKLKIEINPRIDFFSGDYMHSMHEEIENMDQRKGELRKVCSGLEKMVYRGLNSRKK